MALFDKLFGNRGAGSVASIRNIGPRLRATKRKITYKLSKQDMSDFYTDNLAEVYAFIRKGYTSDPPPPPQ